MKQKIERSLLIVCALISLSALLITFIKPLFDGRGFASYGNLISYYTIQTNILVTVYLIMHAITFKTDASKKLLQKTYHSGITIYITITGLVFILLLSDVYHPVGLEKYSNVVNHYFIPIVMLIHWLYFRNQSAHTKKDFLLWQIYPMLYTIYTVLRGSITGFYPYPFVNVNQLGITKVFINGLGLMILFIFMSLLFIVINKVNWKRSKTS